ncbi:MAG: hypothetical protein AAFX55_16140 [Bacteroidota bacterium]
MKCFLSNNIKPSTVVTVLLTVGILATLGMARPQDRSLPLIKIADRQLVIGAYKIDYTPTTFKVNDQQLAYDSIVSIGALENAVAAYFPELSFSENQTYTQLQDSIKGWRFEDLLNAIGASNDSLNSQWRHLELKHALGSSLIALAKKSNDAHVFIKDGKVSSVKKQNEDYTIDKSDHGFITKTIKGDDDPSQTPAETSNAWIWPLILIIILGAIAFGLLWMRKRYVSVHQLETFFENGDKTVLKPLVQDAQTYLKKCHNQLDYLNELKEGSNPDHDRIILGYKTLEDALENDNNLKSITVALAKYFKDNDLINERLNQLHTFLDRRAQLSSAVITPDTIDQQLLDFLYLLDENVSQNQGMFKRRLKELQDVEQHMKGILECTNLDSDSQLLNQLNHNLERINTEGKVYPFMDLLILFKIEEPTLIKLDKTLNLADRIENLRTLLEEDLSSDSDALNIQIQELSKLKAVLQSLVPGNRFDFEISLKSIVEAHLFNVFLKSVEERDTSLLKEAIPEIIANIRSAYEQLTLDHQSYTLDIDTFITSKISPYLDLIVQYEQDFTQENRYLYQFHERYKGLSERLEESGALSPEDKSWFFQQLFSMAFHILDYIKVVLRLPKTEGTKVNYGMVLNNQSIKQLSGEQYQPMTNSALETPNEVRKLVELAREVNIETLEDVLFYGFYIGPNFLKDNSNG